MISLVKVNILVAEDDEDDRFLLANAFAMHQSDCHLQFFSDGQQLLQALSARLPNRLPDLILLDLNMPELDGLMMLHLLKSDPQLRAIPVVILTTSDSIEDLKRCFAAGANAFLTKPTVVSQYTMLIEEIGRVLFKPLNLPSAQ